MRDTSGVGRWTSLSARRPRTETPGFSGNSFAILSPSRSERRVAYFSLSNNTTANNNTAVGVGALFAEAYDAGGTAWDANNTAIGYEALNKNAPTTTRDGVRTTAVGSLAMHESATARDNTALGYQSLYSSQSGIWNSAVGSFSLYANTAGINNTAVGDYAGYQNQTASNNVFLGNEAGYAELGSDRLYIANGPTGALIYGEFDNQLVGIGATDPLATLDVNGTFRVRNLPAFGGGSAVCVIGANAFGLCGASDSRLKKNVVSLSEDRNVLENLERLRGVSFDWATPKGFFARLVSSMAWEPR